MTGGTTAEQCKSGALRLCRRINQACFSDLKPATRLKPFAVYKFRIDNLVCAFKCSHRLAIERLFGAYCRSQHRQFYRYDDDAVWTVQMLYRPTTFTGVRVKFQRAEGKEKVALMLFINGNATLSGLKNFHDSQEFAQKLYDSILSKYKRTSQ